jgi:aminoacyl-histidine dipeptidase
MARKKGPLEYFEEILAVPRESGKEDKIAGYLVTFAQTHHLDYDVDSYSNVIIRKKGSLPYKCEPIILQSHIDMVCISDEAYDFDRKGIEWYKEAGFYKANGTTLGADNGVGMAIILAILHDSSLVHPPIEALFTAQEETTMDGAKFFNYKNIKGKRLISLDGTEENKIEVSSAGMASIKVSTDIEEIKNDLLTYQISISGLLGGHSGTDINKKRGNAIKILANIIKGVDDIEIVQINGGSKENVIPSTAKCIFKTKCDISSDIEFFKDFYQVQYETIKIDFRRMKLRDFAINNEKSRRILDFLNNIEDGVLKENELKFPLTSSNLGVIETTKDKIMITLSIRSSIVGFEDYYVNKAEKIAKKAKLKYFLEDKKPFFIFKENSPLRKLLMKKYKELYHENITLEDVHAGLEGGMFANEIKDIDMCVIGANLYGIHSVNEKVEIESIKRVFEWLKVALEDME